MGDPISTQFGALEKLMKESAEADMRKQVALKRFQLGQAHAQVMARQEVEQHQAEQEGAAQGQSQQPTAPFQLDLPTNGALAERPVQWKNPLSQIAGNAYSAVAQAGAAGPGAAIQEQLRATAGAVPEGMNTMLQGLPQAGENITSRTSGMTVSRQPWGFGYEYAPEFSVQEQSTPNALTAEDIARLRAELLDRMLAEQGRSAKGAEFNAAVFESTREGLVRQYGDKVPAKTIAQIARATAMGDGELAAQLSAGLPAPKPPYDPLERTVLSAKYKEVQEGLPKLDEKLTNKKRMFALFKDAERVLVEARAKTGILKGSSLGQIVQRLNMMGDETSANILQQAFGEQFIQAMGSADFKGSFSEKEGERVAKTTGDFNKSPEFNLKDLRTRNAILEAQIRQHENERKAASKSMRAIETRIGADEYLPPPVEREEPVLEEPALAQEATTVTLTVDGRRANVPADKVEAFMKRYPNAQRAQ